MIISSTILAAAEMLSPLYRRTLSIAGAALSMYGDQPILTPVTLPGEAHRYMNEPYELFKGDVNVGEGATDEFGRVVIKDLQAGTTAHRVKLSNGGLNATGIQPPSSERQNG